VAGYEGAHAVAVVAAAVDEEALAARQREGFVEAVHA
jgi:hypothetical protein